MKKNVLFVIEHQMYYGVCVMLGNILKTLDYSKYDVDLLILTKKGNYFTKEKIFDVNIIYGDDYFKVLNQSFGDICKTGNILKLAKKIDMEFKFATGSIKSEIKKARKKYLTKQYDVEVAFHDGFPVLFTAYGDSKKKISWVHVDYSKYNPTKKDRNLYSKAYDEMNDIVAVTDDVKKSFKVVSNTTKRITVIESLIDVNRVKMLSNKENVEFDKTKLNFVCLGKMSRLKAYPRLLEQLYRLKCNGLLLNVQVHIIGDGPEKRKVVKLIKEYELSDNVKLYGYVKNPYPYVKAADMVLLPSIYEGQSIPLIEAAVLGVPIFATKFASNVYETLNKGAYGLISTNTGDGIYAGLEEIIKNKQMIQKYRNNIKDFVYEDYPRIIKKIDILLNKM